MLTNWPVSGLTLTTPRVQLRWPTLADLDALARCGAEGVHDPGYMPFFSQWTDGDPGTVAHRVLQRHWSALGSWSAADWTLYLVVVCDGEVTGSQSIGARNYAVTREVLLTSWLGHRFQGRGIGTHARAAMLHLAFAGLDADYAVSVVRQDNTVSQRVCKRFGFTNDGVQVNAVRGGQTFSDRYRLDRQTWEQHATVPVEIGGLAPALPMFGLVPQLSGPPGVAALPTAETLSGIRYDGHGDHACD
jgi:RimJ/RimL family protein N-acetyltransferase